MPNGRIGDHPLTDIVVHGRRVYSELADSLIRKIVDLGGRDRISNMLIREFDDFKNPDVARLEEVLSGIYRELASGKPDGHGEP